VNHQIGWNENKRGEKGPSSLVAVKERDNRELSVNAIDKNKGVGPTRASGYQREVSDES